MKKFMALYTGSASPDGKPRVISDADRAAGMTAWGEWMQKHSARIVDTGGPLGTTKRVGPDGITDIRNNVAAYVIVEAETHDEAARMFEGHPHFTIFPGDSVEIMECRPLPGAG